MSRVVLRPLLWFVTFVLALCAVVQAAGRVSMWLLPQFESELNAVLGARGISVSGTVGRWRYLNPVLEVQRVEFPAGTLESLTVELDVLESLWRNRPVARQLIVGRADLHLAAGPGGGWALRGMAPGGQVLERYWQSVAHSDGIAATGALTFHTESGPVVLEGVVSVVGDGDRHLMVAELRNPATGGQTAVGTRRLTVRLDWREGSEGFWGGDARVVADVHGDGLSAPGVSPAQPGFELAGFDTRFDFADGLGHVGTQLRVDGVTLPGGERIGIRASGQAVVHADDASATFDELAVLHGDRRLDLADVRLAARAGVLRLWIPELVLGDVSAFGTDALAGVERVHRWVAALRVKGTAHNVNVFADVADRTLAYSATVSEVSLDPYRGVPQIRGGAGEVTGYESGASIVLNAERITASFPELVYGNWQLDDVQGAMQFWFDGAELGLRGRNMRASIGSTHIAGGFAIRREADPLEQRLTLQLNADAADMALAQAITPHRLPEALYSWTQHAVSGGEIGDVRFGFFGHVKPLYGRPFNWIVFDMAVRDATVRYDEAWPAATAVTGRVRLDGRFTRADVTAASAGATLAVARLAVPVEGDYVSVRLAGSVDAGDGLEFVRASPLREWLPFVNPSWDGSGTLAFDGQLDVPLRENARRDMDVDMKFDLGGVDLSLADYRLEFRQLEGEARYRYPNTLSARTIEGQLFGFPVTVQARTEADDIVLDLAGRTTPAEVYRLLDTEDPGVAGGDTAFTAMLRVAAGEGAPPRLNVDSDLVGIVLDMPHPFGKRADDPAPTAVTVRFMPDMEVVSLQQLPRGDVPHLMGWVHLDGSRLRDGALGIDAPPASPTAESGEVLITGRLPEVDLGSWGGRAVGDLAWAWRVRNLEVGRVAMEDARFSEVMVSMTGGGGRAVEGRFDSEAAAGSFGIPTGPILLDLDYLRWPDDPTDAPGDPLTWSDAGSLPDADVQIESLEIGDVDYGRWAFSLRAGPGRLLVTDLTAEVKGLTIAPGATVEWTEQESHFDGTLLTEDLGDVLVQWGYARSLVTREASVVADVVWSGSPLNFDLKALRGDFSLTANEGNFLDVESGNNAMRVFSLLNFGAIAKRMKLDFSDVSGKGVSFDQLRAHTRLDRGLLEFVEPMEIEGTGSSFQITGKVDLNTGLLDNEMIVTLPVSAGLPWYAAYIALANPIAGLGVLVGERVLRKPLEQFSSAKYKISGTLEQPEVKFHRVFDVSTASAPSAALASGDAAGSVTPPGPDPAPAPGQGQAEQVPETGTQGTTDE